MTLSDIAAVAPILTLITGYWLWLVPNLSRVSAKEVTPEDP